MVLTLVSITCVVGAASLALWINDNFNVGDYISDEKQTL
jgi:hypothetical protein